MELNNIVTALNILNALVDWLSSNILVIFLNTLNTFLNTLNTSSIRDWLSSNIWVVTAFASLIVWFLNEWAKRSYDQYQKKIKQYIELIKIIEKTSEKPKGQKCRTELWQQNNQCWLVCSDEVYKKISDYIQKFDDDNISSKDKANTKNNLMVTLRKDAMIIMPWDHILDRIIPKTSLNYKDYGNLLPPISGSVDATLPPITLKAEGIGGSHPAEVKEEQNEIDEETIL